MLTFDPLSLKIISTSRILPNCWKCENFIWIKYLFNWDTEIISFRLPIWTTVILPDIEKFIPQTSGVGLGLWSGTGCWRRGGVLVGPYLPPPHHLHFLLRPLMIRTRSETGGQRLRRPKHPPDSEKVWKQEEEERKQAHGQEKNGREGRGRGRTNKNRETENKRWKNKEYEWDMSRCEEKTGRGHQ